MRTSSSPAARKSNSCPLASKVQVSEPVLLPEATPPVTERKPSNVLASMTPVASPETVTVETVAVTMSLRSRSSTERLPVAVKKGRLRSFSAIVVAERSPEATVMTGVSFEPVMVTSTVWLSEPPLPSETEMV